MSDKRKSLDSVWPLLALVWLAAMVAAYYAVHKPFGGATALAVMLALLDVLAVGLVVLLGGALGGLLLPDSLDNLSVAEKLAIRVLVGLGLLSLAVFGLVALRWIPTGWVVWLVMLGGLLALRRRVMIWSDDLRTALKTPLPSDGWGRFVAVSVLILLGMALVEGLAPANKWDAMTYHLVAPAHYLRAGGFVDSAWNHFYGFPQLVEMLFLWLLRMRGVVGAAAVLHFAAGGLLLLMGGGLAGRLTGSTRAGWLAAASMLVADSLWGEFAWPYVDLFAGGYVLAAFIMVTEFDDKRRWLAGGLLTGFALSVKYTLAGPAIGLGLLVLWLARREGWRAAVLAGARFTGVALLTLAPWLVKNMLLEGNPFAPMIFPTKHFDEFYLLYYLRPGTGFPLWQLALAPIQGTIIGREGGAPYQASAGALLVAALPLVLIGWSKKIGDQRTFVKRALVVLLPAYGLWLVGAGVTWFLVQTRLLFPLFPLAALVGVLGLEGLRELELPINVGWVARGLVALVVVLALFGAGLAFVSSGALPTVLGLRTHDDYLAGRLGWHYPAMQALDTLPEGATVLFLWEPRSYYCPPTVTCLPDSMISRWWHDRQLESDPQAIAATWREVGVTHVLIYETGMRFLVEEEPYDYLEADDLAALELLREEELEVVWEGAGVYTLYAWRGE